MTVGEFAGLLSNSAILKIVSNDALLVWFDSEYWECITEDILGLEIESLEIKNQLMKKAEVTITVVSAETETESGPQDEEPEPDEGGDTPDDDDPADEDDPADNDGDDGDDGGDEP